MGWFSKSETPTQQFGAPTSNGFGGMQMGMGSAAGAYGMQQGMSDPMAGMMQQQNPFMQQMANDPVMATSRLLQHTDPLSQFIVSPNFPILMDLFGEIVAFTVKDFFMNVKFAEDENGKLAIDPATLPAQITTLSPENMALTLQRLQNACQNQNQMNQQQIQMLLQMHNPLLSGQQQPGFFGSLLGSMIGNQAQGMGGYGAMGAGAAALL